MRHPRNILIFLSVFISVQTQAMSPFAVCEKALGKAAKTFSRFFYPDIPSAQKLSAKIAKLSKRYIELATGPISGGKTSRAIEWIAKEEECTPAEKAKLWEIFAAEMKKVKPAYTNESGRGSDGSYLYRGHVGEMLIIAPNNKVYRAFLDRLDEPILDDWLPPYDKMTDIVRRLRATGEL
jgi:hypothetical protein